MANEFFNQFRNEFDGLEKGNLEELVVYDEIHIENVRFIKGDNGEYAQFTVAEIPGKFFNGSNPVSSVLIMCREADVLDELPDVAWRFKKGVSKQWGSEYIAMSAI